MNSIVRSRMVFGCQTWSLSQQLLSKISAAYIRILRKMTRGGYRRKPNSWSFVLTNEQILRHCGTESIGLFIRRQQRNYLAHTVRRDDTCASKLLTYNDNRRRPGRYVTTESMVLEQEAMSRDVFNRMALEKKF